jgi:hypothetical protein
MGTRRERGMKLREKKQMGGWREFVGSCCSLRTEEEEDETKERTRSI